MLNSATPRCVRNTPFKNTSRGVTVPRGSWFYRGVPLFSCVPHALRLTPLVMYHKYWYHSRATMPRLHKKHSTEAYYCMQQVGKKACVCVRVFTCLELCSRGAVVHQTSKTGHVQYIDHARLPLVACYMATGTARCDSKITHLPPIDRAELRLTLYQHH